MKAMVLAPSPNTIVRGILRWPGAKHSSKARKKENFLDDLSIPVRPFDNMVKAGQTAPPTD